MINATAPSRLSVVVRRQRRLGAVVLVVVASLASASRPVQRAAPTLRLPLLPTPPGIARRIIGVVLLDSGEPLPQVVVVAQDEESGAVVTSLTDESGRFELLDVGGSATDVFAHKFGYVPISGGLAPSRFRLAPKPGTSAPIVLALGLGSAIRGIAVNEHGAPVALAKVAAHSVTLDDRVRGVGGVTDERGLFRIFGLPPDTYVVRAEATLEPPGLPSPAMAAARRSRRRLVGASPTVTVAGRSQVERSDANTEPYIAVVLKTPERSLVEGAGLPLPRFRG